SKVSLAVRTIAPTQTVPSIGENGIHRITRHQLANDRAHELKMIRSQRARDPQFGKAVMPARLTARVGGYPVGMRRAHFIATRMWVDPRDHVHAEFARALIKFSEGIVRSEISTSPMKRNIRRIKRQITSRADGRAVRLDSGKVID